MESPSEREQVLLAMVAVEDGRLSRDALLTALDAWTARPQSALFAILSEQGALAAAEVEALLASFAQADTAPAWDGVDAANSLREALANSGSKRSDSVAAGSQPRPHRPHDGAVAPADACRFEIGQHHATGGLGEVLRATDLQLNREVAVKRIRRLWADDADSRARFLQEAKITGRLEHPGIVPVYALGFSDDKRPYYAMRFIAGDSLEQAIDAYDQQPAAAADRVRFNTLLQRFVDVCNTVEYAHSRGVIHRDLKPANVMLGPYGETVVVDWGLAKRIDDASCHDGERQQVAVEDGSAPTQFGRAVGTPQYMSPEQAAGRIDEQGVASDVFNLGATLYHLLTGQPPYIGSDVAQVVARAARAEFPTPRAVRPSVPKPLEAICAKAMMRVPIDRYASAAEMGHDLRRWLADEPVAAYRQSWMARLARWSRHHQARVAALGVASVLLLLGAVAGAAALAYFERQRYAAQLELDAQARARLAELETSATAASDFALTEMRAGRYASASGILDNAVQSLQEVPRLDQQRGQLAARHDRTHRIVEFQRLSHRSDELVYRGRHPEALTLSQAALGSLDVLGYGDWWDHLPIDDLTPEQIDALRWEVYRELTKITSLYATAIQQQMTRHAGSPLAALVGQYGRPEAQAALAANRLVQQFRPSEANRWIAGMAGLRLGIPSVVSPQGLSEPHNAVDAYSIGMLNVVASDSPQFPFKGYRGNPDALVNAADAFRLASELAPDHYWTHLFLGFVEMTRAQRALEADESTAWLRFADARQALGRCIALNPQQPFGYAERSVAYWREAAALAASADADASARVAQLRDLAVRDAQHARDLEPNNPWLYWYEGHAIQETGQIEKAAAAYLQAIRLDRDFGGTTDLRPVEAEQIRAIPEAIDWAERTLSQAQDEALFEVLLAAAHLSSDQSDLQQALDYANRALARVPPPNVAWSVRGMIYFEQNEYDRALEDFERARTNDSRDIWAAFGIANCRTIRQEHDLALAAFDGAQEVATTDEHHAAAELGRCRTLLHLARFADAARALQNAIEWQPSCDTEDLVTLAVALKAQPVLDVADQSAPDLTSRLIDGDTQRVCRSLPLCNGGFELSLSKYWGNSAAGGPIWWARGTSRATASMDHDRRHGGDVSLHIHNPAAGESADYGTTSQTLPATAGAAYRLTLWASAETLAPGAIRISVDELGDTAVVAVPGGSYDWKRCHGDFTVPVADTKTLGGALRSITVRIVSAGAGDVWLDDLRIELIDAPSP
ncbi:MAG: serine/threonine-protein kinase [Pirellulales bacterium]